MKIDHIGYAVQDLEAGRAALEALGFEFDDAIEDAARKIILAFGALDGYRVELVAPMGDASPVTRLLETVGPTPYHLCYASANFDEDVRELRQKRFKILIPAAPAVAFGGKRVVFMYSPAIGTFEIVERDA